MFHKGFEFGTIAAQDCEIFEISTSNSAPKRNDSGSPISWVEDTLTLWFSSCAATCSLVAVRLGLIRGSYSSRSQFHASLRECTTTEGEPSYAMLPGFPRSCLWSFIKSELHLPNKLTWLLVRSSFCKVNFAWQELANIWIPTSLTLVLQQAQLNSACQQLTSTDSAIPDLVLAISQLLIHSHQIELTGNDGNSTICNHCVCDAQAPQKWKICKEE